MSKAAILVIFVTLVLGGCSKKTPCESLVAAVCKDGETGECANLKRQTTDADEDAQELCRQISVLLPASGSEPNACDVLASMVCSERSLGDCLNMRKEAAGADEKKIAVCAQFKALIDNSRKTSAQKADVEPAPVAKAAADPQAVPAGDAPANDAPAASAPAVAATAAPSETN